MKGDEKKGIVGGMEKKKEVLRGEDSSVFKDEEEEWKFVGSKRKDRRRWMRRRKFKSIYEGKRNNNLKWRSNRKFLKQKRRIWSSQKVKWKEKDNK